MGRVKYQRVSIWPPENAATVTDVIGCKHAHQPWTPRSSLLLVTRTRQAAMTVYAKHLSDSADREIVPQFTPSAPPQKWKVKQRTYCNYEVFFYTLRYNKCMNKLSKLKWACVDGWQWHANCCFMSWKCVCDFFFLEIYGNRTLGRCSLNSHVLHVDWVAVGFDRDMQKCHAIISLVCNEI